MAYNLLKTYPNLLEILALNPVQRKSSLMGVFRRDIEENEGINFRTKIIRPLKKEDGETALQTLFTHLTTKEDSNTKGQKIGTRSFEFSRSERLHWVRYHLEERKQDSVEIFSYLDRIDGRNVKRTYVFDIEQEYVIILEPQRSGLDYYLLTAYYLNEPGGLKQIKNKSKKRLEELY